MKSNKTKGQKGKEIKKKISKPKQNLDLEEEIDSDQLEDLEENQLKTQSESEIEENDDQRRLRLAKSILQETKQELARKQKQEEYFQPVQLNEEEKRLNQALLEKLADKHTQFTQMSHKFKEPKTETFKGHTRPITQAQIDSFGKIMFSSSKDASIIKWDIETKKKTFISREIGKQQNGHSSEIYSISLNYDNKILATSSQDHTIKLWDTQANILIETLKMHRQPVHGVKFGLNSNNLASVSADRTFMLWDASSRSYVDTFFGHSTQANDLDSLNTDDFISAGYDRQIIMWKTKFGSQMIYQGHNYSIDCVRAITQDNFATGSADGSIGYWSFNKRKPLQMIENAHKGCWITALGTYLNSDLLISGSYDGYLNFYKKGKQLDLQKKIKQNGIVNSINVSENLIAVVESQEHRFGRWIVDKKAKNQIVLYF